MRSLSLGRPGEKLSILCLGAHSDDIEIGVGGTLLSLIAAGVTLDVHWCVLSGRAQRYEEARASALDFLEGVESRVIEIADFDDSFFPAQSRKIKEWLAEVKGVVNPDVIFTHRRDDAHQDHREVNGITWNLFRNHLILEYEIPKWDGDLGQPNCYLPVSGDVLNRKIELLLRHFGTQRSKDWFDAETFRGLARLRGMECRAPAGYAEAFTARKTALAIG
jgi:LmbE family N-acetylglucosaminyl deacetylase